jgi:hypothetical protein
MKWQRIFWIACVPLLAGSAYFLLREKPSPMAVLAVAQTFLDQTASSLTDPAQSAALSAAICSVDPSVNGPDTWHVRCEFQAPCGEQGYVTVALTENNVPTFLADEPGDYMTALCPAEEG